MSTGRGSTEWHETGSRGGTGRLRRLDTGEEVVRTVGTQATQNGRDWYPTGNIQTSKATQNETHLSIRRAAFDGGRGAIVVAVPGEGDVVCFVQHGDLLPTLEQYAHGNPYGDNQAAIDARVAAFAEKLRVLEELAKGSETPRAPWPSLYQTRP